MEYSRIDEIAYDLYVESCKVYLIEINFLHDDAISNFDFFLKYKNIIGNIGYYYKLALPKLRKEKLKKLSYT